MAAGVGELIGLNGTAITTNNFFDISTQQPGELDVNSRADLQDPLTASEQGVYTCRIPLESGEMREINIGIYPNTFSCEFIVTVNRFFGALAYEFFSLHGCTKSHVGMRLVIYHHSQNPEKSVCGKA